MVLATTHAAALFALVVAFVCFLIWPNLYKRSQRRWRFELFSLDFALGALACALVAAYTLGTFGPEMSFADRMLVAGRSAQLWVFATGVIFAFGNMLTLVSISLLGLSAALPISFGIALVLITATHFRFLEPALASSALGLLLLSALVAILGSRPQKASRKAWIKGVGLAIWAGAPLALVEWMLRHTANPEFGPGPYASVLMLALGFVVGTPIYNFFFMHIKIIGNPIGYAHYKLGGFAIHVPGVLSGALWAAGMVALLVAFNTDEDIALEPALRLALPMFSLVFCGLLGLFRWREHAAQRRSLLLLGLCCFAAGIVTAGLAFPD